MLLVCVRRKELCVAYVLKFAQFYLKAIDLLKIVRFFRTSRSEFIISVNKYLEAKNNKFSVGMRFKMRFEGDEAPEQRYLGSGL